VTGAQARTGAAYAVVWLLLALPIAAALFFTSEESTTVASHDAEIQPTADGYVTLRTGPFLPDVRAPSGSRIGVEVTLGKTETGSTEELVARYAFIASQPDAQIERVASAVKHLAYDAAVRGAVLALVPLIVWRLVGRRRRRELLDRLDLSRFSRTLLIGGLVLALAALLLDRPWANASSPMLSDSSDWQPLDEYVSEVSVPDEAKDIQVSANSTTNSTKRLVLSAIDTYRQSKTYYAAAAEAAANVQLRRPLEGETVALLVSDRHDNIGMDPVARALADQAGATVILDAGDDTSTGSTWEAFSLDSLDNTFDDYAQKFAVQGNHDNGSFVGAYLEKLDWTVPTGEVVDGPGGGRLLAWDDPRSSGLGNWRDVRGQTIDEVATQIADLTCEADVAGDRVNTVLVHDADMGAEALRRGCVDLVVSGHVHVQVGPDRVIGSNGRIGNAYTNGTTGGAAYAIAVGSKLRRPAQVTMVTYREGRPVGLQPVTVQTNGVFQVGDYTPLPLD
jgi:predicted phosphodiesterase